MSCSAELSMEKVVLPRGQLSLPNEVVECVSREQFASNIIPKLIFSSSITVLLHN